MQVGLRLQIEEKKKVRQKEQKLNENYVKMVIQKDKIEAQKIEKEEQIAKEMRKKCQNIVKMQINEKYNDIIVPLENFDSNRSGDGASSARSASKKSPYKIVGYLGHRPDNNQMSPEEIRFNRHLFEKIS